MDYDEYGYTPEDETGIKPDEGDKSGKKGFTAGKAVILVFVCIIVSAISGTVFSYLTLWSEGFYRPAEETHQAEVIESEDYVTSESEDNTSSATGTDIVFTQTDVESTTQEVTTLPAETTTAAPPTTAAPEKPSKSKIYSTAVHSIVGVESTYNITVRTLFGVTTRQAISTGTGFFVSDDGYIITNKHVVENGVKIEVTDYEDRKYEAVFVAQVPDNDIAILKIDAATPKLRFGSSSAMNVGDDCMIIGNPGALSYTYTDGMISFINRTIKTDSGYTLNVFQTNAAINSGNSGGPVFNADGDVIGIATAKYTTSEGLGFFIPIDDVKGFINERIG